MNKKTIELEYLLKFLVLHKYKIFSEIKIDKSPERTFKVLEDFVDGFYNLVIELEVDLDEFVKTIVLEVGDKFGKNVVDADYIIKTINKLRDVIEFEYIVSYFNLTLPD